MRFRFYCYSFRCGAPLVDIHPFVIALPYLPLRRLIRQRMFEPIHLALLISSLHTALSLFIIAESDVFLYVAFLVLMWIINFAQSVMNLRFCFRRAHGLSLGLRFHRPLSYSWDVFASFFL